ncbi:MAG TPA: molecular chaperone TorD family protein [Gaiellaceae bacterium]|nr:molecular chaperone TorD family protein [Gaiellaceae bacterium]
MTELLRALAVLAEPPGPEAERIARVLGLRWSPSRADYTNLFQLELPPYASVYLGDEGQLGGEARDRVAGFWRAVGLVPPSEADHLAALLGLYAAVAETDPSAENAVSDTASQSGAGSGEPGVRHRVQRAVLWEHVLSWVSVYAEKAMEIAPAPYRRWAALLDEALVAEAQRLPSEGLVPLHLRVAGPLADPREEGLEPFLASLLAPVRSGIVLTRADLVRAARELGLGLRVGERRFTLRALFAQDAVAMLGWLASEAESWGARHRRHGDALASVGDVWAERAERAVSLLRELAETTTKEVVGV